MNKNSIKSLIACAALLLLAVPGISRAELRLGVGLDYISGLTDVADLYIDNIKAPFGSSVTSDDFSDLKLPVGLKFTGTYQWESGVRTDFNVGPFMMVLVSVDSSNSVYDDDYTYFDAPLGVTVGYTFLRNASVSPYARVGLAHHIVSGDFNESSSPGLLAAVGVDFMRMRTAQVTIELALDKSEVEFDRIRCSNVGTNCRTTRQSINTSDIQFGVAVKF